MAEVKKTAPKAEAKSTETKKTTTSKATATKAAATKTTAAKTTTKTTTKRTKPSKDLIAFAGLSFKAAPNWNIAPSIVAAMAMPNKAYIK